MSLVAWYPLNGNTNDYSGNGYHLTNSGNASLTEIGKIGNCLSLTGNATQKLLYTNFPIYKYQFSWSVWAYCNGTNPASYAFIVSQGRDYIISGINIATNQAGDTILIFIGNNTSPYSIPVSLLNTWRHIILTGDGTTLKTYVDGILKDSRSQPSDINFTYATDNALVIGKMTFYYTNTTTYFPFNGKINDVRIYDHALSEKEIKEIAKAKILHYTFDDFQEPTSNLWSGNLAIYNNFAVPASLTATGEYLYGAPIYRLAMTVDDAHSANLSNFQTSLANHGVYGSYRTYLAYTKYADSICWRPVNKPDTVFGGTASNIGGWTSGDHVDLGGGWKRYTQYRDGTVTTDKTDNVFFSFYCPSLALNETIYIDVACPQIEQNKIYSTPYTVNSRSGVINDQSGFRNNATLALATTPQWASDSKIGSGAYKFNGVNDYLNIISPFQSTQQIYTTTISFWIKLSSETTNYAPIFFNGTSGIWLSMKCEGSALWGYFKRFGGGTNYFRYGSSSNILYDTWYHVVFSFNNGIHKWYLNGSNVATLDTSATDQYLITGASSLMMGSPTNGWNGKFKGNVSDFKWFATELSDTDILELYQTRASIDNTGNIYSPQFVENIEPTINYSTNSNIETGTTTGYSQPGSGSTGTTITVDSSIKYSGNYSLKLSRTGDTSQSNTSHYYGVQQSNTFGSVSGKTLTFSAKVKTSRSGIKLRIQMQRGGGNWQAFVSSLYTGTGDWQTIYVTGTFDNSDSLTCYSRIYFNDHTTSGNGDSIYIDEWQMENINHFTPFIIGARLQSESLPSTFVYKEAIQENGIVQADSISEIGITNGLIAYYPFDKDANDYSGNNYHGTSYNTSLVPGIKNQAYSFNGTTSYIASTFAFPISYSIGCWFKHNGWTFNYENHLIASNDSWAVGRYRLYYKSTDVRFDLYDQFASYNTTDHLDGNWHHLFATFYNGTLKLYFDSNLVSTNSSVTRVISTSSMSIGRLYVNSSDIRYHVGSIDEVRIYDRALSEEEIATLYDITNPSGCKVKITKDTIYMRNEIKEVY